MNKHPWLLLMFAICSVSVYAADDVSYSSLECIQPGER